MDLGCMAYPAAWEWQRQMVAARIAGHVPDTLAFVEHPHVYTLGRSGHAEHVLIAAAERERLGIATHMVDRGGDVTYHGPGQLVGYPILDLAPWGSDIRGYGRMLEAVLIQALADYGIAAARNEGYPGVWVEQAKVAAIGVRVSQNVTSHGFALNVNTDLWYFSQIVPCGIHGCGVTSMARLLGREVPRADVARQVAAHFEDVFGFAPAQAHHVLREESLRFADDAPASG